MENKDYEKLTKKRLIEKINDIETSKNHYAALTQLQEKEIENKKLVIDNVMKEIGEIKQNRDDINKILANAEHKMQYEYVIGEKYNDLLSFVNQIYNSIGSDMRIEKGCYDSLLRKTLGV